MMTISVIIVVDDGSFCIVLCREDDFIQPSLRSYLYIGERVVESFFRG